MTTPDDLTDHQREEGAPSEYRRGLADGEEHGQRDKRAGNPKEQHQRDGTRGYRDGYADGYSDGWTLTPDPEHGD
ncbi:hypothetical protein CDG81_20790 [Actinopolyspora erythraea]|uniref:Uncharacterized protein n=1 Tax=Actinopolyspora erythraea TaxID=414996 RepID=A0A099DB69_9ACTN|nr:hypothetical protein [Actinopolyspora erythraea]ASU80302.1 hypothetical protein CDG81_20790 [Actinopolyspora erythraea]KGI82615.1 hypothetical protein IL38_04090 [Actinopolyspora erythraea]